MTHRAVDDLNRVVGKWRRGRERKRVLEPYPERQKIDAERLETKPPARDTTTS